MSYNLTGATVSTTYGRIVQVVLGTPNTYYDGFGNLLDIGPGTYSIGPAGPTGPTGSNGSSVFWAGEWDDMMLYSFYDIVSYNGNTYLCIDALTPGPTYISPDLDSIHWTLMAAGITGSSGTSGTSGANGTSGTSGANGTSGTSGDNGSSGTSGTSGDNGSSGTSGTSGDNGSQGPTGPQGPTGSSGFHDTIGVTSSSYSVILNNNPTQYFGISHSSTSVNITIPDYTSDGKVVIVKDESGNASIFPITVNASKIDQSNQAIIALDNGSITMMWRVNTWWII
jgi:hypothetical protein